MQLIRNSVGTNTYRNFYVRTEGQGEFDSLRDGVDSCAFFVSAVLVLFRKLEGVHGTVARTVQDLERSGWVEVSEPTPGDVLVWEAGPPSSENPKEHIGFYIDEGKAISNSSTKRTPIEHDIHFGDENRKITKILRTTTWDQPPAS
ncbi:MAG TPA: hypothetical protein VLH84_00020 [Patescibacteria group bacterium]|nr:hypothetical protein [Patescibacteria group bacterium]